ncbi:MAG: hypothetical protein ABSF61_13510, partial [Anaerolineales bacterium]
DRGYPTMRIGTFLCEVLAHPKDDPDALFLLVLPSHIYLNLLTAGRPVCFGECNVDGRRCP